MKVTIQQDNRDMHWTYSENRIAKMEHLMPYRHLNCAIFFKRNAHVGNKILENI